MLDIVLLISGTLHSNQFPQGTSSQGVKAFLRDDYVFEIQMTSVTIISKAIRSVANQWEDQSF